MNTILHDRQLEEYYCTLCYAFFDFKRARGDAFQFRAAVSRCDARAASAGRSSCRRAARVVSGRDLRRGHARRCMRATCSCSARTASSKRRTPTARSSARRGCATWCDAAPQGDRAGDRRRDLRRRHRVPRGGTAGRRHDRRRGESHRMSPDRPVPSSKSQSLLGLAIGPRTRDR